MEKIPVALPQGLSSPLRFLKESRAELSKVVWPSRREIIRLTAIVLGVSVAVGAFIGGLDYVFVNVLEVLVGR